MVDSPVAFIRSYYDDLRRRDAEAVMEKWQQPPRGLRVWVARVEWVQIHDLRSTRNEAGSPTVQIDVTIKDVGQQPQRWGGPIELEAVNGQWKILRMRLSRKSLQE
jgi:hypothetical protein